MPYPPGKSKEVFCLELRCALLELDEDVERLSRGVNAVWAVCEAIQHSQSDYAKGLWAVWEYLDEADEAVRRQLDHCLALSKEDG